MQNICREGKGRQFDKLRKLDFSQLTNFSQNGVFSDLMTTLLSHGGLSNQI